MSDQDLRTFARVGALAMCLRAIAEFPDILAELNKAAQPQNTRTKIVPVEVAVHGPRADALVRKTSWTPAKRKAHSQMMKKRWAARRRATK